VAFQLTNSVGNLGGIANTGTFISFLHFTYTEPPAGGLANTDFSLPTLGSIETGPGAPPATAGFPPLNTLTDASLQFNLNLDLPTAGNVDRFTNGEFINWTVSNAEVANFTSGLNSGSQLFPDAFLMVHVQGLNVAQGELR
jgi:hypothetical protein